MLTLQKTISSRSSINPIKHQKSHSFASVREKMDQYNTIMPRNTIRSLRASICSKKEKILVKKNIKCITRPLEKKLSKPKINFFNIRRLQKLPEESPRLIESASKISSLLSPQNYRDNYQSDSVNYSGGMQSPDCVRKNFGRTNTVGRTYFSMKIGNLDEEEFKAPSILKMNQSKFSNLSLAGSPRKDHRPKRVSFHKQKTIFKFDPHKRIGGKKMMKRKKKKRGNRLLFELEA